MLTTIDIMTSPVSSISAESTVEEAVSLMLKRHVSGLPVVDEHDDLVGVVTEFDMLSLIFNLETCHEPVSKYMTRELHTIDEDMSVVDIADVFLEHRIRRLLVVDGKQVIGVISRRDVIQVIHDVRERMSGRSATVDPSTMTQPTASAATAEVAV